MKAHNRTWKDSEGTVYTIITDRNGKPRGVSIGSSATSKPSNITQPKLGDRLNGVGPATKDRYYAGNAKYVSYARAKQLKLI